MTTSATGGYLVPDASPAPLEDDELEDFLHDLFAGLTGMDNDAIRPRWQPEPPNQPDFPDNWMAFGVMNLDPDTYAVTVHDATGDDGVGVDGLQRHETIEVLISSYGPNAGRNLSQLRDGLQIEQNRAILSQNAWGLVATGQIIPAPSLMKDRWLKRLDMNITFRREIRRTYSVRNLASAVVELDTEVVQETITVTDQVP